MNYVGDFRLGDTLDVKFCTVTTTGAPTQLAGSPAVAAYPGNSTTEITAGITLTVDFDSRTGLNNVRVVASGGNGYATATNYYLVITAGTVGGTSVVGYVVGAFSIENRSALMPTTAARTLLVDASGNADARLADAVSHGGTLGSSTATMALSRLTVTSQTSNTSAITATGNGTGHGIAASSGTGATGNGINAASQATNGNGLNLVGNGTGNGLLTTGGAGAGGDGLEAAAGGGVAIRGSRTGDLTGNVSGSVGSVTGAVGSVTGNVGGNVAGSVGSVTGAVGSVTGNVGGNVSGSVASVTGNVGGNVAGTVGSVTGNVGGNVTGSIGSLAAQAKADVNAEVDTALSDVGLTTTITGRIDAAVSTRLASASYTAPLDAAGTRSAMGLASANLDTQLAALPTDSDVQTAAAAAITASEPIDADVKKINGTTVNGDGGGTPWGP